jgi:hypothetical protein
MLRKSVFHGYTARGPRLHGVSSRNGVGSKVASTTTSIGKGKQTRVRKHLTAKVDGKG